MLPDWAHFQPDLATLNHVRLEKQDICPIWQHKPKLDIDLLTLTHVLAVASWLLWLQPELQHKTANHNCPLAANHNVAYAHSSVQPMILCNVISRRRTPRRSGSRANMVLTPANAWSHVRSRCSQSVGKVIHFKMVYLYCNKHISILFYSWRWEFIS